MFSLQTKQELSYRKQIVRQLLTQHVSAFIGLITP